MNVQRYSIQRLLHASSVNLFHTHKQVVQWVLEQNAAVTVASDRWLVTGAWIKVGHHHGSLVTQTRDGKWLVEWDNLPASQLKQYGESPESGARAASQIELISV